jgi:hypothetical protein
VTRWVGAAFACCGPASFNRQEADDVKSADDGYTAVTATGLNPLSGKVMRKSGDDVEVPPSVLENMTIMLPQNSKSAATEPVQQQPALMPGPPVV